MSFESIKLDQQGPVSIISLTRPQKLNAINKTMLLELDAALDDIEKMIVFTRWLSMAMDVLFVLVLICRPVSKLILRVRNNGVQLFSTMWM
jgi:hypothetical protein